MAETGSHYRGDPGWDGKQVTRLTLVYDCFMFCDELEVLEIRLHELDPVVDRFVVVEGDRTFSGKPKPLYFADARARFGEFDRKIIHVTIRGAQWPAGQDAWTHEHFQRNQIMRGLSGCTSNDVIIISDADEIPTAMAVAWFSPAAGYRRCLQLHHCYYLNALAGYWTGSVMLSFSDLCKLGSPQAARELPSARAIVRDGGWHFGYLGGPERIRRKIESSAHTELDREKFKDLDHLRARVEANEDLFGRPELRCWTIN